LDDLEANTLISWEIANEAEVVVVIISMPFDLAVFAPRKGLGVFEILPEITNWYIAYRSLGGAMASPLISEEHDIIRDHFFLEHILKRKNQL